eukprot:600771-Amorphochlora_amoeboformis.AAC.1
MSQIDLRGGGLFFLMASICSRGCITLVFEPIQTQMFRALTANRILGGKAFLFLGTATIVSSISKRAHHIDAIHCASDNRNWNWVISSVLTGECPVQER